MQHRLEQLLLHRRQHCEQGSNCTDQQSSSDHDRSTTGTTANTQDDKTPFARYFTSGALSIRYQGRYMLIQILEKRKKDSKKNEGKY
jgi:hypothetical protein